MKKLKLDAESVTVESFPTGDAPGGDGRGTVRGEAACTYQKTCLCPSAYYYCGTGPHTIYSCDYTNDRYCGPDTSFEQCATPPEL